MILLRLNFFLHFFFTDLQSNITIFPSTPLDLLQYSWLGITALRQHNQAGREAFIKFMHIMTQRGLRTSAFTSSHAFYINVRISAGKKMKLQVTHGERKPPCFHGNMQVKSSRT